MDGNNGIPRSITFNQISEENMSKKPNAGSQRNTVSVGNITGVSGNLNIAGGNIETHQTNGLSAAEIRQLFDGLYTKIDTRENTPPNVKEGLKADVEEIQEKVNEAVEKKETLEENFLLRRFKSIARMAPDILDVVVASLANPLGGLGVAVAKIAQKAKEDTGAA
jgi:hypothetical protein